MPKNEESESWGRAARAAMTALRLSRATDTAVVRARAAALVALHDLAVGRVARPSDAEVEVYAVAQIAADSAALTAQVVRLFCKAAQDVANGTKP